MQLVWENYPQNSGSSATTFNLLNCGWLCHANISSAPKNNEREYYPWSWIHHMPIQWASYQIRKNAGCACAENAENVFPITDFKGNRSFAIPHASRHVRLARVLMHVRIANPRCRGKRSRHFWRMRNLQFCVSGKRPMCDDALVKQWTRASAKWY